MNEYRIIEATSETVLAGKSHRGDEAARSWLRRLTETGAIHSVPVNLQRRRMTDEQAATLPPFADGRKQSAWVSI